MTDLLKGTNALVRDIYFAPDHAGPICPQLTCGTNPVGVWSAQSGDITTDNGSAGPVANQRLDWAFVRVHPEAGELPVQRVARAAHVTFGPSYNQHWTM